MKKINFKCPYCYEVHTIKTVKIKCNFNRPNSSDVCVHHNLNQTIKRADGFIVSRYNKKCLKCKEAKRSYFCPNFNKEVPQDFLYGKSLSLALLGAKYSGKSNYIAVIINEIRRTMSLAFDCAINLTASDESNELYNTHYYKPLYEHMVPVEKTAQGDMPPLIFPVRFLDKRHRTKRRVSLTFYDTAGENLDSNKQIEIANRYIPNANGIILLVDPLQVPRVRDYLKGKVELPAKNTDALDILSRTVQIIRNSNKVKGKIKVPLALVFTKMDTLYDSDLMLENSLLKEDSIHIQRKVFVEEDFQIMQEEMKAIMDDWLHQDGNSQFGELVQMLNNFSNYAVFGVSSFGSIPIDNGTKLPKKVNPRLVLDPFLWILAQKKIIPTTKN